MRWDELADQNCSVARALSVIGDRWTLLILRDCFLRVRRFDDFQKSLGLSRRVLAERLTKLVDEGVLEKERYQERPPREEYRLTQKGIALYPVVMTIMHWGDLYYSEPEGPPIEHLHLNCGETFDPVLTCSACHEPLDPRSVRAQRGPGFRESPAYAAVRKAGS